VCVSCTQGKMHIGAELTLADAKKVQSHTQTHTHIHSLTHSLTQVYLSEDATWYETRDFCHEKGIRLCHEQEV
jgi:hypothetical protein